MNIERFFPEGTKRRQLVRGVARVVKGFRISNFKKIYKSAKSRGLKQTLKSIYTVLFTNYKVPAPNTFTGGDPYQEWIRCNEPTEKELNLQRKHKFKINPKISLIVPMYNTPVNFFEELVDSLILQTYSNWELCLADGSPEKNDKIEDIVKKDKRIIYLEIQMKH